MPRPSKSIKIIEMEGRKHLTKQEIAFREQNEAATLTGQGLIESKEVRENPEAHKAFLTTARLLGKIDKNDAIYSEVINRYCLLKAEILDLTDQQAEIRRDLADLKARKEEVDADTYFKLIASLGRQIDAKDRMIMQKRNAMFAIERENIMTIASALRSVQKRPEKKANPLMEALGG